MSIRKSSSLIIIVGISAGILVTIVVVTSYVTDYVDISTSCRSIGGELQEFDICLIKQYNHKFQYCDPEIILSDSICYKDNMKIQFSTLNFDKTKYLNSVVDRPISNSIHNTFDIQADDSIQIEVSLVKDSHAIFRFEYKDNIVINANDKSRKAANELLYAQVYDPNDQMIVNLTGMLPESDWPYPISNIFHFVPKIAGNYSAVIVNPQSETVIVTYNFGDIIDTLRDYRE